jgi:hypothetical protein
MTAIANLILADLLLAPPRFQSPGFFNRPDATLSLEETSYPKYSGSLPGRHLMLHP